MIRAMAGAVARWQAQERREALVEFQSAIAKQPQWKNPKWVGALYSPLVASSIQEMDTELERGRNSRSTSNRQAFTLVKGIVDVECISSWKLGAANRR
jgi:hypothetical protein